MVPSGASRPSLAARAGRAGRRRVARLARAVRRRTAQAAAPADRPTAPEAPTPPAEPVPLPVELPARLPEGERERLLARAAELEPWLQGPFPIDDRTVVGGPWRCDDRWAAIDPVLGEVTGARALDVGANAGWDAFMLRLRGCREVLACEPHHFADQLAFLEQRYRTGVQLRRIGWQALSPLDHGRFDLVHCGGLLFHEPDVLGLLLRLREMTADGGRLLLGTMVALTGAPEGGGAVRFVPGPVGDDPTWWWLPDDEALRGMLAAVGFAVEAAVEAGSGPLLPPPTGYRYLLARAERPPEPALADSRLAAEEAPGTPRLSDVDRPQPGAGVDELSPALRAFAEQMPWERESILRFVARMAAATPRGARVLDVGAGEAPYRELFAHVEYVTADWEQSPHAGAARSDVIGSADALPIDDGSFDAVLLTQVLEHVPDPARVLAELHRVLRPGGRLWATVPFAWELHEEPFDFYRYTRYSLEHLLGVAGFEDVAVHARNDSLTTLAQLTTNVSWRLVAQAGDVERRRSTAARMRAIATELAALAALDQEWGLPLGWTVQARKPAADQVSPGPARS